MEKMSEEVSPKKTYYTISEVAKKLQLTPSLIRFWEKEFSQLSPRKTKGGSRKFTIQDIDLLRIIEQLVKKQGYKIEGAKQALQKNTQALRTRNKHLQELKELHHFLCQLRDTLQR